MKFILTALKRVLSHQCDQQEHCLTIAEQVYSPINSKAFNLFVRGLDFPTATKELNECITSDFRQRGIEPHGSLTALDEEIAAEFILFENLINSKIPFLELYGYVLCCQRSRHYLEVFQGNRYLAFLDVRTKFNQEILLSGFKALTNAFLSQLDEQEQGYLQSAALMNSYNEVLRSLEKQSL